jgi:hypothetical protein
VAWIDFDSARPGPRLHGVAYSAYHVCLTREPLGTITEQDAAMAAHLTNGHAEPYAAHADLIERSESLRHLLAKGAQP